MAFPNGKYKELNEEIIRRVGTIRPTHLAEELKEKYNRPESIKNIRKHIYQINAKLEKEERQAFDLTILDPINESKSITQGYESEIPIMPSAWDSVNQRFYTVEEYCIKYGLNGDLVKSAKLVAHVGSHMIYNIVFKEEVYDVTDFDYIGALEEGFKSYVKPEQPKTKGTGVGVITLADLHFGAYILDLKFSADFTVPILLDMLDKAVTQVNRLGYETVHVHLLGDLIESFTGMNHPNTWHGLKQGMIGANVIKQFVELIDKHFLSKINNLGSLKIIAGNHDRATDKATGDTKGWAADLIAWGFELLDYDVEFSSSILVHTVDHITYILNHGHLGLTKLSTEDICWKYGIKGNFNFVMEGHLHSRIAKLTSKARKQFKMITDDTVDCRRQVCPSLFTGNGYSEDLGFSTTPGYIITEANNNRGVNVFDFSL